MLKGCIILLCMQELEEESKQAGTHMGGRSSSELGYPIFMYFQINELRLDLIAPWNSLLCVVVVKNYGKL